MRQLTVKTDVWTDLRFAQLLGDTGWRRPHALGVLVFLWWHTRTMADGAEISRDELRVALEATHPKQKQATAALVAAGYVREIGERYVVVDNEPHFAVQEKLKCAGARGGYHRHKKARAKRTPSTKPVAVPPVTNDAWEAYQVSYRERYGVDPVPRNSAINGQLARLVGLVGKDAPRLVRFYLSHENAFYLRVQHSLPVLLRDYAGLHTQMQRNVSLTEHDVTAHSENNRLQAQLRRLGAT